MMVFTHDQWVIVALVFVLGLLIGAFLTAGGRRKWKTRHSDEIRRREALEREYKDRESHWADREKEWREQDTLRGAALKDRDRDGVKDDRPL